MSAKVLDGRYKLIKVLGAGGFGRTYIARDMRRPGTPTCVVKQLKPASDDPGFIREARRLFNTEAETLEKLGRHDQIPQLLAYFEENQQFFLVQEFIEGRSLYSELKFESAESIEGTEGKSDEPEDTAGRSNQMQRGRQLSEPEVIAILKDILNVLEFVHEEGVIHRDIKPDNLIRRHKDRKLVLIDFGAVKAMQEAGTTQENDNGSRFTVTIGTPGYMPSEQCAGRPTFSSDIYAAGMVAIKALTGYAPTELPTDPDTGEVIWRNQTRVSNGLAMVLTRMVRYHYTQRYQSVKEVMQGLAAFTITEDQKKSASTDAITKPITTATTKTVAKSQSKSNSGSELLVVGLLILVSGVAAFILPNLFKSNSKPALVASPVPTLAASTNLNASAKPTTDPQTNPNSPDTPPPPGKPDKGNQYSQTLSLEPNIESVKTGNLKAGNTLVYTLSSKDGQSLAEGQMLKVELSGEGAVMTLVGPDNSPVSSSATQVKSWEGKLSYTGDYQLQLKTQDKPEVDYTLKVILVETSVENSAPSTESPSPSPTETPAVQ